MTVIINRFGDVVFTLDDSPLSVRVKALVADYQWSGGTGGASASKATGSGELVVPKSEHYHFRQFLLRLGIMLDANGQDGLPFYQAASEIF